MAWGLGCLASTVASLCAFGMWQSDGGGVSNATPAGVVFAACLAALVTVGVKVGRRWDRWGFLWGTVAAPLFWAAVVLAVGRIG